MFNIPAPKRGFTTEFHCTACGHTFRRELRRIYVDGPTFEQRVIHKQETRHSEYVIPQRVACPKCGAVDQYELTQYTLGTLSLTMTASLLGDGLVEGHPVRIIAFALADGQPMHPLDALEYYRQQLATAPQDQQIRMRYANTLRTLGYFDEAGAEYAQLVGQNPALLEAWYNLAAIDVALKRKRKAKKTLQCLVAQAEQASALSQAESNWAYNAQLYLDGVLPLDKLIPQELFDAAKLSGSRSKRSAK
jgi:tetratricopeptide (TPR) repeat protein